MGRAYRHHLSGLVGLAPGKAERSLRSRMAPALRFHLRRPRPFLEEAPQGPHGACHHEREHESALAPAHVRPADRRARALPLALRRDTRSLDRLWPLRARLRPRQGQVVPQSRPPCTSWGLVRRDNNPSTHADTNSYAPDNSHTQGIFHDAGPRNASANSTKDKERNDREDYRKR